MKALDEYILIVIFVLLLKRVHFVVAFFKIRLERHASERVNEIFQKSVKYFYCNKLKNVMILFFCFRSMDG